MKFYIQHILMQEQRKYQRTRSMKKDYMIVRDCVSKEILRLCENYFRLKFFVTKDYDQLLDTITCNNNDVVKPFSIFQYADTFAEALLIHLLPVISKTTKISNLQPTYSFVRFYENGQHLVKHTDRPSCQYSITLPLASGCNTDWPIFVGDEQIDLNLGDLLVYKGCDVPHWREKYEGTWQVQAHLHYVDGDDPAYSKYILDNRPDFGVKK